MPEISPPSSVDVLTQLVTGPSLREVATAALRPALKTLYPHLDIDPQLAMVVTPTWVISGKHVIAGVDKIESLTDVLVRLGLSGTTVTYLDEEHFLTLQPYVTLAIHLPVKIGAIASLINELAPLLFVAFKEQQIEYWNKNRSADQPRWYELSDALRNLWNVPASLDWTADEQAMALAVFNHPDKKDRAADKYKTCAYLIDLDREKGEAPKHLTLLTTSVLIGTLAERTLIITHSVGRGFRRFSSVDDIGKALPQRYRDEAAGDGLSWRLVEPEGNFFDHMACTLVAIEADAVGKLDFFKDSHVSRFYPHPGTEGNHQQPPARLKPHIDQLRPMLPEWLDTASPADQTCYSRHLLDLTVVQHENNGKSFQSEVKDLHTFTREALTTQILKDHPKATDVKIDDIELTIVSLVIWGTFVVPFTTQTLTMSLPELALQNLAGLPLGNKSVRYKDGSALPAWMSAAYLEKLVTTVDIGSTYPAYLKKQLVDDATQAPALRDLYTSQLPVELPLLALQRKILGEAGITEQGYRYVVAALSSNPSERRVDGEEIVIRPLAFVAHRSSAHADTVVNMFVIGPRQSEKGPCLLYRPLFEKVLIQYPGPTNLLYAIRHGRALRESVLAWLPDSVRLNYSQYVFTGELPSAWIIPEMIVHPSNAIDMTGPVTLGSEIIETDTLATLHKTNVQALITQADRQSVSNAEGRWATLKRGGWMLFNAALPFLGRSLGAAAWIWQIMDDLQEVTDVANESDKIAWSAIADILLALGMALAHRAAVGHKPIEAISTLAEEKPLEAISLIEEEVSKPSLPTPEPVKTVRLPDLTLAEIPTAHASSVNHFAALKRSPAGLAALLDRLKTAKPQGIGVAAVEGRHQHLYAHEGKWYAPVGQRWFQVQITEHEHVQIIDSRVQPPAAGPFLTCTAGGEWVPDLRLRLRGGGLSARREVEKKRRREQAEQLNKDISTFEETMETRLSDLQKAHSNLMAANDENRAELTRLYLIELDSQHKEYGANIEKIKALQIVEASPSYRTSMIQNLQMQLFFGQEWLALHSRVQAADVATAMAIERFGSPANTDRPAFIQTCENLTDQCQAIIEKIESAHTRFAELERLGKGAVAILNEYRQKLPDYDLNNLKLLQIFLGKEICVKPGSAAIDAKAQEALELLIEDADLNAQSSLNLIDDESLDDLRDRLKALNNVSKQFGAVEQRFDDFALEFAEQLQTERLKKVRTRVIEFKKRTAERLADLLRNKHLLAPQSGPSRPASNRRIIHTKFKGTQVGERKTSTDGKDTHLVEVRGELTGVIATFHEKSPGEWVEHITSTEPAPVPVPKPKMTLKQSTAAGQALLDGLAEFNRHTEAYIERAQRIPVEVEEIYHRQATRLRNASEAIDQALTAGNETTNPANPTLSHSLSASAQDLYEKGTSERIRLIKRQPPTEAGVQWLNSKNEVRISQTVTRRRLKSQAKDFLDEYAVSDAKTNKVLWYAHFHYAHVDDAVNLFTAGHLKTVAQQRLGGAFTTLGASNQELTAIYRSEIGSTLAQSLFFTTATPGVSVPTPL